MGLDAVTIEGGLIAPEQVAAIAGATRDAKLAASYDVPKGLTLPDEISRYFRIGQGLWRDYDPAKTSQEFTMDPSEKTKPYYRVAKLNRD